MIKRTNTKNYFKKYRRNQKKTYKLVLSKHYDILTAEEKDAVRTQLIIRQDGCCIICGQPEKELNMRLSIDHCHTTGHIRGLLCHRCNFLLGFAKDNLYILQAAIDYLIKSKEQVQC